MNIFLKKNAPIFTALVALIITHATCVNPPDYPLEPVLSLPNSPLSKNTIVQDLGGVISRDSLYITINFTDGDGDIGFEKGDSSLYIIDKRDNARVSDVNGLPQVPPQGAGNGVSGNFRIRILGGCCKGIEACAPSTTKPTDVVVYEIYIKDRAGNVSNKIQTPPVTILCQ